MRVAATRFLLAMALTGGLAQAAMGVEILRIEVLAELPHDPHAFTQGLLWHDGLLYESTGLYTRSSLRQVDPLTGEVLQQTPLDPRFFGEGLARVDRRLYQLTWQEGVLLVYDAQTFAKLAQMSYPGEGWGLTYDGTHLWMSDGSARLTVRDPKDFRIVRRLEVTLDGRPITNLNELEWVDGAVWANVLGDDRIFRIDPASGRVSGVADASGLLSAALRARADVLNGIAHDPATQSFWITGKLWPKIFQVRLVSAAKGRTP